MQAIALARSEMETVVAKLRITNALKRKVPPAATTMITPGSQVLVYREKEKQWVGPVIAKTVNGKTVHIQDHLGNLRPFSVTVCKPYLTPTQAQDILFCELKNLLSTVSAGIQSAVRHTFLTEVLPFGDSRRRDIRFNAARQKEIQGLQKRRTWDIIPKNAVPANSNIIGGRFVYALKNPGTPAEKCKARFVAQSHTDREKDYLIHCTTTLHRYSIPLIISIAAIHGFRIWTHDVTEAHLQSKEQLSRDV